MRHDTPIRTIILLIALAVTVPAVQAALTVEAGSDRIVLAGEPVTILAVCNDTDVLDATNLSASVDWSTATTEPEIVPDDEHNGTLQATYTYLTAGTYTVTVEVANNATGTVACDTLNVTVDPQPATLVIDAGGDRTALAGEPIVILATYNGTDVIDAMNLSATVDWSTATTIPEIVPDDDRNGTLQAAYAYPAAGTYTVTVEVANNATGTVACDTLNVTVDPQSAEVKVVPKTLNQKSNGIMTVFVSLAEWLGFGDAGSTNATIPDPSKFSIGNATPEKVNFCMKDGGTLILKYDRQDLDLAAGDGNLTVTGNAATENGTVSVAGHGAVSVINPGNGNRGENGNGKGYAESTQVKEKVKNQGEFAEEQQNSNGKTKGQAP